RPVTGVLVPGDGFAVVRHLAEKVGSPGDDVGAQQVFDTGHDPFVREDVVHAAVLRMRGADRITVAPGGDDSRQQPVGGTADLPNLGLAEDGDSADVAVAVELDDLRG